MTANTSEFSAVLGKALLRGCLLVGKAVELALQVLECIASIDELALQEGGDVLGFFPRRLEPGGFSLGLKSSSEFALGLQVSC